MITAGPLPAVLAACLPAGARVLELGTGTGAGTAWIASALLPRTGVTVITVDKDPATAALAAQGDWPGFVELRCARALDVLGEAGRFDPSSLMPRAVNGKGSTAPSRRWPRTAC